jgi:hypothetical protein
MPKGYPDSSYAEADFDKLTSLLKEASEIINSPNFVDWMIQTDKNYITNLIPERACLSMDISRAKRTFSEIRSILNTCQ